MEIILVGATMQMIWVEVLMEVLFFNGKAGNSQMYEYRI